MSIHPLYHRVLRCMAVLLMLCLGSCSLIKDDLHCPSGVWLKLEVTMDVEYGGKYSPQSFADDMGRVSVWVFDQNGLYLDKYSDAGENLKNNNNTMNLPIEPGKYKMVVWTGMQDPNYQVLEMTPGVSTMDDLDIKLVRDENNCQSHKLSSLWHGYVADAEVKPSEYTRLSVKLTKNTNTVIAVLQDYSGGTDFDSNDYTFEIVAENGYMDYTNKLLPDADVRYNAYFAETAQVSAGNDDTAKLSVARAEMNTLRFMANRPSRFVVTEKNTGAKILNINLTEYLLLTRELYNGSNGAKMSEQAYLDYEDMYRIVFFLAPSGGGSGGGGGSYFCVMLSINGWIVRLNDISDF